MRSHRWLTGLMMTTVVVFDAGATCSVFPPDYDADASLSVIAEAVGRRDAWKAAGCGVTEVVRQEYFQDLYRACVDALPVPPGIEEDVLVGAVRYANDAYQEKVRACQANALSTAEAATFAGNPPTLMVPEPIAQ